jgi:hypothetical protein
MFAEQDAAKLLESRRAASSRQADVAGVAVNAGVGAVGAAICRRSTADGGEVPQVPRPLGHGAARPVAGALSDGVRCVVWGTGVDYVVFA